MIKKDEVSVAIERHLAMSEALRRLGFQTDEIYLCFNSGHPLTRLAAQEKEFYISLCPGDLLMCSDSEFEAAYDTWCKRWNKELSNEQRFRIFSSHVLEARISVQLVAALLSEGFEISDSSKLN